MYELCIGAGYLIYLGIRALQSRANPIVAQKKGITASSYRNIYVSGMLTNILNPKVALFFIAFLPQFVIAGNQHSILSFLILGATFITTGTIWCLCLAVFASLLTEKLTKNGRFSVLLQRVTGGIFIGLGLKLALSGR